MITCDWFLDLDDTTAVDGTTLTTTILTNGTHGPSAPTWTLSPSPPTGLTINRHNFARHDHVLVRGDKKQYVTSKHSRSIRINHNTTGGATFTTVQLTNTGSSSVATMAGYITLGPPPVAGGGALCDYVQTQGASSGASVTMQLNQGQGATPPIYSMGIESGLTGSTTHSTYYPVTQGHTYWFCLLANYNLDNATAGSATHGFYRLQLYDAFTNDLVVDTQLKEAIAASANAGEAIGNVNFGQNEGLTTTGDVFSYLENLIVDYSGAYPIYPGDPRIMLKPLWKTAAAGITIGEMMAARQCGQIDPVFDKFGIVRY